MTKKEAEGLIGKFGEIRYNGRFYPSRCHGFISELNGARIRIERLEGDDIWVKYEGMKFIPKPQPIGFAVDG